MPNNCNGRVLISGLTEKHKERISRWAKNNTLCEMIVPYPKDVKLDLKNEKLFEEKSERIRKGEQDLAIRSEKIKALEKEYPYKQLWYNRRIQNWGSKWGLCDCSVFPGGFGDDLELYFRTAWGPQIPVFKSLSKKYHCSVSYDYDEPGCGFSGRVRWVNGELVYCEEYDDPYYGEGERCSKCGFMFDGSNEDDWADLDLHICYDCGHKGT